MAFEFLTLLCTPSNAVQSRAFISLIVHICITFTVHSERQSVCEFFQLFSSVYVNFRTKTPSLEYLEKKMMKKICIIEFFSFMQFFSTHYISFADSIVQVIYVDIIILYKELGRNWLRSCWQQRITLNRTIHQTSLNGIKTVPISTYLTILHH